MDNDMMRRMKWILVVSILGMVEISVSSAFVNAASGVRGMIVADNVRIREEPNTKSEILAVMKWGDIVDIHSIQNDWAKICWYRLDGNDEIVCGWIYAAFFDPCHKHFRKIEPQIEKGIAKYKSCIQPSEEKKEEIKNFLRRFKTAYIEKDYVFFKKHSAESILDNYGKCERHSREERPVSKYAFEHESLGDLPIKIISEGCTDLPKSSYCKIYELSDYLDDNNFFIETPDLTNDMTQLHKYSSGDCTVIYGTDWIRVVSYGYEQESYCGIRSSVYFRKIDDTWKLIRVDIYGPC